MARRIFNIGDLVIVGGSTMTKEGVSKKHQSLARVIEVGKKDISAVAEGDSRVFNVSKSRCVIIDESDIMFEGSILRPSLGDLCASIAMRYSSIEKKIGVVTEIIDIPGKTKLAKILKGEKDEIVSYDSLIVLEQ